MKAEYEKWIRENVIGDGRSMCYRHSEEMVATFPELIRVRGWVNVNYQHWWCKTKEGEIVDPTAAQFASLGALTYTEFQEGVDPEPIGKCMNCAELIWEPGTEPGYDPSDYVVGEVEWFSTEFCCQECRDEYVADMSDALNTRYLH